MRNFLKKNKFKILAIALVATLIFTLTTSVFGTKYEVIDFSVRKSNG